MDIDNSRKASLGQIKKAVLDQRNKKNTSKKLVDRAFKKLGINTRQYKKETYEDQKEIIGDVREAIEEGGGDIKGYGVRGKEKGILKHIKTQKQANKEQFQNRPGMKPMDTKQDIASKRINLSELSENASNGPSISIAQNQNATISLGGPKPTISAVGTDAGHEAPRVSISLNKN